MEQGEAEGLPLPRPPELAVAQAVAVVARRREADGEPVVDVVTV